MNEISGLSLEELIGRGPVPYLAFAKLDRKMDQIFGEPAWKKVTVEPVTFETIIENWMDKTKNGKKKGPKARQDMERAVRRFTAWLKSKNLPHEDMTQVRFENCRDYRDHLYATDPNPGHFKTHSNHLAILKALFSCAAKTAASWPTRLRTSNGIVAKRIPAPISHPTNPPGSSNWHATPIQRFIGETGSPRLEVSKTRNWPTSMHAMSSASTGSGSSTFARAIAPQTSN